MSASLTGTGSAEVHDGSGLKVLHVLQYSLPNLMGYAIRSDGLLRGQREHGIEAVALTGCLQTSTDGAEEVIRGVRYLRTRGLREANEKRHVLRQWKLSQALIRRLSEVIQVEKPDILHVHSPPYNGLAAIRAGKAAKVPVVYEVRGLWEDAAVDQGKFAGSSVYYWMGRALETHVLRRADAVTVICDGLRREVAARSVTPRKIFKTENGVDMRQFRPRPRDEELARSLGLTGGPVFGFIGSLFRYEGVEDLLDAIPEVWRKCPRASFLIVGWGERERDVQAQVEKLKQAGTIVYRGKVPHEEVLRYYSVTDAMVYPRRRNRITDLVTPLKPLEAMAMEKAVIASNVGGHKEMVRDGETGVLYEAGKSMALVDAIARVASAVEFRVDLARRGRQYVEEERNWKKVSAPYVEAYSAVLRQAARFRA